MRFEKIVPQGVYFNDVIVYDVNEFDIYTESFVPLVMVWLLGYCEYLKYMFTLTINPLIVNSGGLIICQIYCFFITFFAYVFVNCPFSVFA